MYVRMYVCVSNSLCYYFNIKSGVALVYKPRKMSTNQITQYRENTQRFYFRYY